jgi:hypothetical protein
MDATHEMTNKVGNSSEALRIADPWRLTVRFRRNNPGKRIADSLPALEIDPVAMDAFSEMDPLHELPGAMSNKFMVAVGLEIPKWGKRGKIIDYGWGVGKSLLRMYPWQPLFERKVSTEKEPDLDRLKREIREFASSAGYSLCGFTKIDRRFIAEGRDDKFPFDTAIVLGMEMDRELLEEVPFQGKRLFDFEVYVESGRRVFEVAQFIRSRGYRCRARVPFDGWVKYPPHAIMAGLGELGAHGVVITREHGPRQRWTMISIDADIEKACPGDAISHERIWWRGVKKRKNNDTKCYPFFRKYDGCGICIKVCPINRHSFEACMEAYNKDGTILGNTDSSRKHN